MRKRYLDLTELEGAVLTEIGHRGNCTAFRVRRAFELSGSANWRGSAGAVYAAIKRLTARGLLDLEPINDIRGGNLLALTPNGRAALDLWALDVDRSADVGFDPFRLRSGLWLKMKASARADYFDKLEAAIDEETERLQAYASGQDTIEQTEIKLAIELQKLRKRWLKQFGSGK